MSPSPGRKHQEVSMNSGLQLGAWAKGAKSGKLFAASFEVILSFLPPRQHYLELDLIVVVRERLSIINDKNIQGSPDLVVEIISKTSPRQDGVADSGKGVLSVFILDEGVYPSGSRYENDAVCAPAGFPGLEINLGEVWGD